MKSITNQPNRRSDTRRNIFIPDVRAQDIVQPIYSARVMQIRCVQLEKRSKNAYSFGKKNQNQKTNTEQSRVEDSNPQQRLKFTFAKQSNFQQKIILQSQQQAQQSLCWCFW